MAIYGIGAKYERSIDKMNDFLINNCACIGWEESKAPATHKILKSMKIGDIVYIKSMDISKKKLNVRAIGIVFDDKVKKYSLGNGVQVKWIKSSHQTPLLKLDLTSEMYKNNVFNNTLYEEFNPAVQIKVLNELFGSLQLNS